MEKAKWLSEEALQIAVKGREVKSKGEKERYSHLNAEFRRIARRDKKAFLAEQCKETEETTRMGKIRDLFKKIRDTKGTFQAKKSESEVPQSCPTLCNSTDYSWPGSFVHGNSPGKNTGVGCHTLLQEIFPTQGWNPGL